MQLTLGPILTGRESVLFTPISELGATHSLTPRDIRMFTRYFGLSSVALSPDDHSTMLRRVLLRAVRSEPLIRDRAGTLIYCKTQTHNTPISPDWLKTIASDAGLEGWETFTLTMNHCASALSAVNLLKMIADNSPAIIISGEKCFHAVTSRQTGAALGEMPVVALFNKPGPSTGWSVVESWLSHAPRFWANPARMTTTLLRDFERDFARLFGEFIEHCLAHPAFGARAPDLIVPYNLNLPLLRKLASDNGWRETMVTPTAATHGHLFCSDVFVNLANVLPTTEARSVFCFAAGMGASFSAILLERCR